MTIAERNNKLKHFITCLKCEVSGKCCDVNCSTQYDAGNMGEIIENLEAISKALEQEPTTKNDLAVDCISRDDVRNVMQELWGTSGELMDRLMALPSVTPQPCEDVVSRQAVLDLINADWKYEGLETEINNLPSVTPQEPRKGHWIDTDEWRETVDGFEQWGYFRKCSKCGYVFKFLEIDNYCPNCGADMREVKE